MGSRFYCLSVCKVMMSACPEFSGSLSGSVGLGVMPPALALASVPLVRGVLDGGVPRSAALTPAAVTPLVTPHTVKKKACNAHQIWCATFVPSGTPYMV